MANKTEIIYLTLKIVMYWIISAYLMLLAIPLLIIAITIVKYGNWYGINNEKPNVNGFNCD